MRLHLVFLLLVVSATAMAGVPDFVTYSGRLTDGTAWGQSTTLDLTFRVYGSADGDDMLWQKEYPGLAVEDGYFSVLLGDGDDPGTSEVETDHNVTHIFAAGNGTWIAVCVGDDCALSDGELKPRRQIGSVPYAVRSEHVSPDGGVAALKAFLGYGSSPEDQDFLTDEAFRAYIRRECPLGYERVDDASIKATGFYCRKAVGNGKYDEMVKVGDYWIDRYETSIWTNANCTGTQLGGASDNWQLTGMTGTDNHHGVFSRNGDWKWHLYACSMAGVIPSRWITWFQAQAVCQLSGKHLCTNGEWQGAAQGVATPDHPDCNTGAGNPQGYDGGNPEVTGSLAGPGDTGCVSRWGAFDMVGNLEEWVDLWGQAGRTRLDIDGMPFPKMGGSSSWPPGYGNDRVNNINGEALNGPDDYSAVPASALRGGYWTTESGAGAFRFSMAYGPAQWADAVGARCCRR